MNPETQQKSLLTGIKFSDSKYRDRFLAHLGDVPYRIRGSDLVVVDRTTYEELGVKQLVIDHNGYLVNIPMPQPTNGGPFPCC
jgi:hypothetical protein